MILLPSSVARALASSTMAWARRSASARRWADSLRAWPSATSTLRSASVNATLALSAAARPSAIFWARSSSAFAIGGHTNFIVNPTRIRNTIIWTMRVPVMLTFLPLLGKGSADVPEGWTLGPTKKGPVLLGQRGDLRQEGVGGC